MSTLSILIEQTLSLFIVITVGIICCKAGLIDDATNKKLTNILLTVMQPVLIFNSFQMEFDSGLLKGLLISLLLAFTTHIIAITISYIFIRRKRRKVVVTGGTRTVTYKINHDAEVERLTSSYSNMGLLGMPLIHGIFGNVGVFYVTAYVMTFNIFMYTHGVIMISGNKKIRLGDVAARLKSPALIAIFLGLIFFILQIKLPNVINRSLDYIGSIYTPFGMLIAGATIAKSNIMEVLTKNLRIYYIVFLRLLLIPIVIMLIYVWLPIDETIKTIAIILSSTPTTTIGTLLTIRYDKNSVLAAEIFAITTLLCVLTIPLIMFIANMLMKYA